ncbi:MAG: hypothetical protein AABM40_03845 [Chloroflexota bacterium]
MSGSSIYADFIEKQLAREDATQTSLEARGLSVVSTSGTLVTLLFGLGALISGVKTFVLSGEARDNLFVALVLLVMAAVAAIASNLPMFYKAVTPASMRTLVKNNWTDPQATAEEFTSETRIDILERAQTVNTLKGYAVLLAMGIEVAGVFFVAKTVGLILSVPLPP